MAVRQKTLLLHGYVTDGCIMGKKIGLITTGWKLKYAF